MATQITYMSAPSHSSPRSPRDYDEEDKGPFVKKKERVTCVAVVDPFSYVPLSSFVVLLQIFLC